MNATELADELQNGLSIRRATSLYNEAATMLRQLQAENEALKLSLSGNSAQILSKNDETLPNGKLYPVAWMFVLDGCRNVTLDEDADDETRHNGTPLYTHPAKT